MSQLNPDAAPFAPLRGNAVNERLYVNIKRDPLLNENQKSHLIETEPKQIKEISSPNVSETGEPSKQKKKNGKKKKPPKVMTLDEIILKGIEKLEIKEKNEITVKRQSQTLMKSHNKGVLKTNDDAPNNTLDSSAPKRKRGKEKEKPKPKKPTQMKKIIINEKNRNADSKENKNDSESIESQSLTLKIDDIEPDFDALTKRILHGKSYREYCTHALTDEIDATVKLLINDLVNFQDRAFATNPIKAKMRQRLAFGFREVTKYAEINKVKALIIAPDIESIESRGGLNDVLQKLLCLMSDNEVPVIYTLTRIKLGNVCRKKGRVSCVGILNYDGSQDKYKKLIVDITDAQCLYKKVYDDVKCSLQQLPSDQLKNITDKISNHIPLNYQHFRSQLRANRN